MTLIQATRRYPLLFGTAVSAALFASSPVRAQAINCATVKATSLKMFDVPYHMYMVDSGAANEALHGGKPTSGEVISAGGQMYVLNKGKWMKSPVSLADLKKAHVDNADSTKFTCSHLRDESVNGEAAAVWRSHVVNEMGTADSDMWISKSRGVLLKAISVTDVGGPMGKSTVSARYDYANVRPPAGVP